MNYKSRFESIGSKIPERRVTTKEIMSALQVKSMPNLERITGIKERRFCTKGEDSYSLAVDAARDCLRRSSYKPEQIEMLVSCSITRHKDGLTTVMEPPLSVYIKDTIGANNALSFDISNACAGMFTGVNIVNSFIERGIVKNGMVVSGEYISNLSDNAVSSIRDKNSDQVASLTLGDAGSALILEKTEKTDPQGLILDGFTTLSHFSDLCTGRQCKTIPGAVMETKKIQIHNAAVSHLPKVLDRVLKKHKLSFDQIDFFIPHQTSIGSIKIGLKNIYSLLAKKPGKTVTILEKFGNTASTSHFIALQQNLLNGRLKKGNTVLLASIASGLVLGIIVFKINDLVSAYGN